MLKVLATLACLAIGAHGHSYLTVPVPRGGVDSNGVMNAQAPNPCLDTFSMANIRGTVSAGEYVTLKWTNEAHRETVTYANLTLSPNYEATTDAAFMDGAVRLASYAPYVSPYASLRIPRNTQPGIYAVQYKWSSGPYVSCVDFNVTADKTPDMEVLALGQASSKTFTADSNLHYFEVTPQSSSDFFSFSGSSTGSVKIYIKSSGLPNVTSYDYTGSIDGNSLNTAFCTSGSTGISNLPATTFVAVSGEADTQYSVKFESYSAQLNYVSGQPRITTDSIASGNKFYKVSAWSTYDTPKRVVVRPAAGTGQSAKLALGNQCTTAASSTGGSNCADLPYTPADRYVTVSASEESSFDYGVSVEAGTCQKLATSPASTLAPLATAVLAIMMVVLAL